ncbi:hypothetical protein BGZ63DRAFT_438724, partial [Mariannaea sp. PMI_226]
YTKPFKLVQQVSSKRTYRGLWKRALVLVLRAYRLDSDIRDRLAGIRLKRKVERSLEPLWNHPSLVMSMPYGPAGVHDERLILGDDEGNDNAEVERDKNESGDEEDSEEEEDSDDEDDAFEDDESENAWELEEEARRLYDRPQSNATEEKHGPDERSGKEAPDDLIELLFGLNLALCTEHQVDSLPSSTMLVYYSGVLGMSKPRVAFVPLGYIPPFFLASFTFNDCFSSSKPFHFDRTHRSE